MAYTTWGPVTGDCGHLHKTKAAARLCIEKHQCGCAKQGGYSDRHVREVDGPEDLQRYDVTQGPGRRLQGGG